MIAGTDPMDGGSLIGILSLKELVGGENQPASSQAFTVKWSAVVGRDYRVESAVKLIGPWSDASGTINADEGIMEWSADMQLSPSRFFRIIALE